MMLRVLVIVRFPQSVGGDAPFARGGLPAKNEAADARSNQPLGVSGDELTAAALRVKRVLYVLMKIAKRDRLLAVPRPPEIKQFGDCLPPPIALFRLADPQRRVLAAEREQRVAYPLTPLLEAAQRQAPLQIRLQASPPPDRERCG
jgi:hypothetical protein